MIPIFMEARKPLRLQHLVSTEHFQFVVNFLTLRHVIDTFVLQIQDKINFWGIEDLIKKDNKKKSGKMNCA